MKLSTDRILTTHVGSLPRPDDLIQMMTRQRSRLVWNSIGETLTDYPLIMGVFGKPAMNGIPESAKLVDTLKLGTIERLCPPVKMEMAIDKAGQKGAAVAINHSSVRPTEFFCTIGRANIDDVTSSYGHGLRKRVGRIYSVDLGVGDEQFSRFTFNCRHRNRSPSR